MTLRAKLVVAGAAVPPLADPIPLIRCLVIKCCIAHQRARGKEKMKRFDKVRAALRLTLKESIPSPVVPFEANE